MKTKKTVPTTGTNEITESITCDICGNTHAGASWAQNKGYDQAETEVRYREGTNYPDSGSGTETTIDICPECFTSKLIPWVQSHGGKPTVREWEW